MNETILYIIKLRDQFSANIKKFDTGIKGNIRQTKALRRELKGVDSELRKIAKSSKAAWSVTHVNKYLSQVKKVNSELVKTRKNMNRIKVVSKTAFSASKLNTYKNAVKKINQEFKNIPKDPGKDCGCDGKGKGKDKEYKKNRFSDVGGAQDLVNAGVNIANDSIMRAAKMSDVIGDLKRNVSGFSTKEGTEEMEKFISKVEKIKTRTSDIDLLKMGKMGGKLGVPTAELEGFIRVADKAGVGLADEFNGNVEKVAGGLGKLAKLYDETKSETYGKGMQKIGSIVNALGKAGNNTAPEMFKVMTNIGQLGEVKGSVTKIAALSATLIEAGLSSNVASGGLVNMYKIAGQETKKWSKVLDLTEDEFKRMYNASPEDVFMRLAHRLKGVSNTDVISTLKYLKIGTQESLKAVLALSKGTDTYEQRLKVSNEQLKNATDLNKDFAVMNQTGAAQIAIMRKEFERVMIKLGKQLMPVALKFGKKFADVATWVTENWSVISPIITAVGIAISIAAGYMAVLNIVMWANPVMAIIAGVALLATFFIYNFDRISAFVSWVWDGIKRGFWALVEVLKVAGRVLLFFLTGGFSEIFAALYNKFEGFRNFVDGIFSAIKNAVFSVLEWLGLVEEKGKDTVVEVTKKTKEVTEKSVTPAMPEKPFDALDYFGGNQSGQVPKKPAQAPKNPITTEKPTFKAPLSLSAPKKPKKGDKKRVKGLDGEMSGGATQSKNYNISIAKFFDKVEVNLSDVSNADEIIKKLKSDLEPEIRQLLLRILNSM